MQVRATVDCFVDGTFRYKGEQFEYTGAKNENLEQVKAEKTSSSRLPESENER